MSAQEEARRQLELQFHNRMMQVYEQAKSECNYDANRFRNLVLAEGGLSAARKLLILNQYSEGLTRLWEEGRLDLSMEAAVLEEQWQSLFTRDEIDEARNRLNQLGYTI